MRIVWAVPEKEGGIAAYSRELWPAVRESCREKGWEALEPVSFVGNDRRALKQAVVEIAKLSPDLVHVQHEYGAFGGKVPTRYMFPEWVKLLREEIPNARIIATAHTVILPDFKYPLRGRGVEIPLRVLANTLFMPGLRRWWNESTWSKCDGVIVHSELQREAVFAAGCPQVEVIPHYVPKPAFGGARPVKRGAGGAAGSNGPVVLVFGYFSPEKGQDLAIEAFAKLRDHGIPEGERAPRLILAGGVRRRADQTYFLACREKIAKLGLRDRVRITGFVPADSVDDLYSQATLVLAPFHETAGSGSLPQALSRGAAVLTSDLALNRDLESRVSGSLSFFRAGDAKDCANKISQLLSRPDRLAGLREAAKKYSEEFSVSRIGADHAAFYATVSS